MHSSNTMTEYPVHPAAALFPMLSEAELGELAGDIKVNGLLEPIILWNDMVLDGRNRMAACKLAAVEPRFDVVSLPNPTGWVISKNLRRRHLTTSQRAAIAVEAIPMLQEEAKERQLAALKQNRRVPSSPIGNDGRTKSASGRSVEMAAESFQVGTSSVNRAIEVKKHNPELLEKVKVGEITVSAAQQEVREQQAARRPAAEKDTFAITTERHRQLAQAQYKRMTDALDGIQTLCESLRNVNLDMVHAVCSSGQIETWGESVSESVKMLRSFDKSLKGDRR